MSSIKLSLIIPIYGVEDYIAGLLKSLLPQLNNHVECIFVNDGTKDKSFEILKEYLTKYPDNNYQLLEQENQGLSMARNNGMKLVKGEYFGFIDSDDEVEPNYIEEILNVINTNEFDIMHFNAIHMKKNNNTEIILADKIGLQKIDDIYIYDIFNKFHWYACFRIFNKKYLNILYFPENKTFEDALAIPECYEYTNVIYELPIKLYRYINRSTSIVNSKKYYYINFKSFVYGINKYRKKTNIKEYISVYSFMVNNARKISIKLSFNFYRSFIKHYQKDILSLLNFSNIDNKKISNKHKFLIKHPYIFYCYEKTKAFFNFKWIKTGK